MAYMTATTTSAFKTPGRPDIFLICPRKHMLWVLIGAGASNGFPQHMFSWTNKKNTDLIRTRI